MVKTVIYVSLISLAASTVLAAVPEAYQRREVYENDLLPRNTDAILEERDYPETMSSRDVDIANLEEREPFFGLIGMVARIGLKIGTKVIPKLMKKVAPKLIKKAGSKVAKNVIGNQNNQKRKRDIEQSDLVDELFERELELDMIERELNEDDILGREIEEDLYLD